ncbi:ligase-associated DNA damage response endonuclease PdeM [Pseudomonas syringae]|uniref:ligase-associated DNA damage response endonuclease PdeM n=1 Tax=Pseudomonas syringae TaxID=317 RepID=UPI0013730D0C|nr:ligase-associated DNA damage response endonuclease PdeM [Pseudomonas syringae]MDU8430394.1 ligase-associated DNA damage response endonuclease PdeM [Pseudomonas syringae pv. actinidifoliorum]MDU8520711.1 ligase-associated DNA damage response endonuclease PdeM [Pseudomonas syringae pv. actinidifoliorum]MDU8527912.1 ligase-associated DNA damage response endonuclease PdeM [Pseudomonas syringae pv. actinidifoliorum]NAT23192.1 DEAD/DEAH box helicase [Pseudomonas syringae pv. actinidifoliorum]NAT3
MNAYLAVTLAGAELWLLADKAVYYPAERSLLIADAHFGKAAAYRKLGQPVPHGTTQENLRRLDSLLNTYPCDHLIFLGDFLHAPESHAAGTLAALEQWRAERSTLRITLIRGNHDKRAGDPPGYLDIDVVPEPLPLGPFALQHEPDPHHELHVLAGHVHPVYRLYGRGRQSLRLACFYLGQRISLLPAFGEFTGGFRIQPVEHSSVYVTGADAVWRVV